MVLVSFPTAMGCAIPSRKHIPIMNSFGAGLLGMFLAKSEADTMGVPSVVSDPSAALHQVSLHGCMRNKV